MGKKIQVKKEFSGYLCLDQSIIYIRIKADESLQSAGIKKSIHYIRINVKYYRFVHANSYFIGEILLTITHSLLVYKKTRDMIIKKLTEISLFILTGLCLIATPVYATTITSLSSSSTTVARYQKFELSLELSRQFASDSFLPYYYYDPSDPNQDPNGISVDATFVSPSGKQIAVPGFYFQDFIRSQANNDVVMTPTGNPLWKVRFSPSELGQYQYFITIKDSSGSSRYPTSGYQTFVSQSSNSHGFLRVSSRDSRFMEFDDGTSFIPIASGHQWWKCCGLRSYDYENVLPQFGANGINFMRLWDQNDGYNLTVEGHFDAYRYPDDYNPQDRRIDISTIPKGTQMNQRGNWEEDRIFTLAEQNHIYIQLCSHFDPWWIWQYSEQNGFNDMDPRRMALWKRNFRYRVARWGYSTSVLAWELWNEHGNIPEGSDIWNFYAAYIPYQKATDPYHHLITTSQGSRAYSPAFWSKLPFDIANFHDYMMISNYPASLTNDEARFTYQYSWCAGTSGDCQMAGDGSQWVGPKKPFVFGEMDVGTTDWNIVNPKAQDGEGRLRFLHNSTWAGLFSPMGTSPIDWYWENEQDPNTMTRRLADRKVTSNFFSGMDYAGANFSYFMTTADKPPNYTGETVSVSNDPGGKARVFVMRSSNKKQVYFWLQNRDYTWYNSPTVPAAISPSISIGGLLNEPYKIEIWNTHTGSIISTSAMIPVSGTLTISITGLTNDIAVKIESTAGSLTPTPTAKIGDVNNDGSINAADLSLELQNYANFVLFYDLNQDKKANVFDAVFILKNWGS